MRLGVDYSLGKPNLVQAKADGMSFICRYLSTAGNPKNLTLAETVAARALGLDIVLVFETDANRATAGWNAGVVDARAAQGQAGLLGFPAAPVYFAVDFDVPDYAKTQPEGPLFAKQKLGPVGSYLEGAASVLGKERTGVYGGYYVVRRAFDAGLVKYGWQTFAWSGGQWDPRAQLQQVKNGQSLYGGQVDVNHALTDDFGQATVAVPSPAPQPVPAPANLKPLLRQLVLAWKARGVSWSRIAETHAWKLFRNLGGR